MTGIHDAPGDREMEACLLDYVRSYSQFYSRAESKTRQRAREQMYQEREMGDLVSRLEKLHGSLEGVAVLELGSGSGARSVAVALRGARVVGIEPSDAGVAASRLRARRYPGIEAGFQVGFGERLPFPDNSFDLIVSTDVLQHVRQLDMVLEETRRVLRPGGHCYHEVPNNGYPWEFHYRMFWVPYLPKPLGKLYARLRGKDSRHLDDIGFFYRGSLFSRFRRHGFTELGDMYPAELFRKARDGTLIRGAAKQKAYRMLSQVGLAGLALRTAIFLGVYPQLRVHATRPAFHPPSRADDSWPRRG